MIPFIVYFEFLLYYSLDYVPPVHPHTSFLLPLTRLLLQYPHSVPLLLCGSVLPLLMFALTSRRFLTCYDRLFVRVVECDHVMAHRGCCFGGQCVCTCLPVTWGLKLVQKVRYENVFSL